MQQRKYDTGYGSYELSKPYRIGRTWFRDDTFTSKDGGYKSTDLVVAAGKDDYREHYNSSPYYGGYYDPNCGMCYLGYTHTKAYHDAELREHDDENGDESGS